MYWLDTSAAQLETLKAHVISATPMQLQRKRAYLVYIDILKALIAISIMSYNKHSHQVSII